MAKDLGDLVSRVLESKDRSWDRVVFQQKRPPLDSEFNLFQDIFSEKISDILKKSTPSGFLLLGDIQGAPEDRNNITSSWRNAIKFKNPVAIVNGWILHIGGGTNQFQENELNNIWSQISNDQDEIALIIDDPPTIAQRDDLVFLEVWQKVVDTEDFVYKDGFVQSALDKLTNDMIDPALEIETSKRVQIRYRFRSVEGVDFTSYREGLGYPGAYAKGSLQQPNQGYIFRKHPVDSGLYISGNGNAQSQKDLGTLDGYVYALPIARIHRRNKNAYSLTNQNGASYSLLEGLVSDRPDGLFYDEINTKDVEDLRHQISLEGFDFQGLLNQNMYDIWSRKNPSEIKRSSLDETVVGNQIIQIDGISGSAITGVDTNNRVPDSFKRTFNESKDVQKTSFTIISPQLNNGRIWFTPKGQKDNGWEYELWDEKKFYLRANDNTYEPVIYVYDEITKERSIVTGGNWINLGEFRTYDYLTGNRNKVQYIPDDLTKVQNKKIVIMFDVISREGGGLSESKGGFNYHIEKMLDAKNNKDDRPIDFNHYKVDSISKILPNPRKVGDFVDSALTRSISRFSLASNPSNTFDEVYKGSCLELTYYVLSTGDAELILPTELYGRQVFGIYSVFNVTSEIFLNPQVELIPEGWEIAGLTVDTDDILKFTLLLGNYSVDFVPHTRGIRNIASVFKFTSSVNVGDTEIVVNVKNVIPNCDAGIANLGYFNGNNNKYAAFINGKRVAVSDIEGLDTPVIKYTLEDPATEGGSIDIYLLGYYNPTINDKMWFAYEHIPYKGIINSRLGQGQTERFIVKKVDENVHLITSGTGSTEQFTSNELLGLASTLPNNADTLEYNLFGKNIETPLSGGQSSLRKIPGRSFDYDSESEYLREGMVLTLGNDSDVPTIRGASIISPMISESALELSLPEVTDGNGNLIINPDTGLTYDLVLETDMTVYNHMTQWAAIVEGLDTYKGELFLLIVTTYGTVYNETEGPVYKFLEEKDLYVDDSLGMGKETLLKTNQTGFNLSQRLGTKIFGAADIYPLRGRPLTNPSKLE